MISHTLCDGLGLVRPRLVRRYILGKHDSRLEFRVQDIEFIEEYNEFDRRKQFVTAYGLPQAETICLKCQGFEPCGTFEYVVEQTSRLTLSSSDNFWSKAEIGATNMMTLTTIALSRYFDGTTRR
jgi:hypothetical protein